MAQVSIWFLIFKNSRHDNIITHFFVQPYGFDGSCQGTVPESIIAFLDSKDYEDALRLCISLGGDADTMGAITGAIAGAYYNKMPYALYEFGMEKLPKDIQNVVGLFNSKYGQII